ncbi:MAG TPA: polyprenyl diphosphate synthase [Candidatus Woesebacteria bacterium]|nr:polyprenyl diphosphate synthase [Candidatus Woesebacteria bacterium]HNS65738.1 polyprenyl diphosphate synthase [Candidatus Woesebacteria bacterium]
MNSDIQHVAIIMDGNRRWAKQKGLSPTDGHREAAVKTIEPLIQECVDQKIPYVTFWAFSTENWKRDKEELSAIFNVFRFALKNLAIKFIKEGVKLNILGEVNRFPDDIAKQCLDFVNKTRKNSKITVTFALNYGGRAEIIKAVKKIVEQGLDSDEITEELFTSNLNTSEIPDPDLIIRTGGEQRLSGFMPWQSIYSELIFTPTLFPDFSVEQFRLALEEFRQRERRFGGDAK